MLGREVVLVVWSLSIDFWGKAFISNADYIMSSLRHIFAEVIVDERATRWTLYCLSLEDIVQLLNL